MLFLFLVLGAVIVVVYAQMHRDTTLSNVTDTTPGELGTEFWVKLIGFGVGPVLGLLATAFPELTGALLSWVQPGLDSMK
jgi:H+/gluconate symporter-like permease